MADILIVEDDPNNQRVLSYMLSKVGHKIRIAANGVDGLAALSERSFDLAIVDYAMPVMDGLRMLQLVRADDKLCNLPVIILTASGDDSARLSAEREGVSGFLTKPSSSRTVLLAVTHALDTHTK